MIVPHAKRREKTISPVIHCFYYIIGDAQEKGQTVTNMGMAERVGFEPTEPCGSLS